LHYAACLLEIAGKPTNAPPHFFDICLTTNSIPCSCLLRIYCYLITALQGTETGVLYRFVLELQWYSKKGGLIDSFKYIHPSSLIHKVHTYIRNSVKLVEQQASKHMAHVYFH
jgi:hypothetical protein